MSKYNCKKCLIPASSIDFTKDSKINAVYVECKACGSNAWGGLDFHPAMNEVFNYKFSPNYDYQNSKDHMCKTIELDLV